MGFLLTAFAILVKGELRKLQSIRHSKRVACYMLCAPLGASSVSMLKNVFYICRVCDRSLLCFSQHKCNLRSDDTETQQDILEAETESV